MRRFSSKEKKGGDDDMINIYAERRGRRRHGDDHCGGHREKRHGQIRMRSVRVDLGCVLARGGILPLVTNDTAKPPLLLGARLCQGRGRRGRRPDAHGDPHITWRTRHGPPAAARQAYPPKHASIHLGGWKEKAWTIHSVLGGCGGGGISRTGSSSGTATRLSSTPGTRGRSLDRAHVRT